LMIHFLLKHDVLLYSSNKNYNLFQFFVIIEKDIRISKYKG